MDLASLKTKSVVTDSFNVIKAPVVNNVLTCIDTNGTVEWRPPTGSGGSAPGGPTNAVQYNAGAGFFGGSSFASLNASGDMAVHTLASTLGITGATVSATGNITSTGGDIIATVGDVSGNNVTATNLVSAATIQTTGSINSGLDITASSGNITGNTITSTNALTAGSISSTGNITSATVSTTGNITSSAGNITATAGNVSGSNVTATNILSGNSVNCATVSATGNIGSLNGDVSSTNGSLVAPNVRIATGAVAGLVLKCIDNLGNSAWGSSTSGGAGGSSSQMQYNSSGNLAGTNKITISNNASGDTIQFFPTAGLGKIKINASVPEMRLTNNSESQTRFLLTPQSCVMNIAMAYNVTPTAGYVLHCDDNFGNANWRAPPAIGSGGELQYNNGGALDAVLGSSVSGNLVTLVYLTLANLISTNLITAKSIYIGPTGSLQLELPSVGIGKFLTSADANGTVQWQSFPIGGTNEQVQYNSSGNLAGSSNLTFDGTVLYPNALNVAGTAVVNGGLQVNTSFQYNNGAASTFVLQSTNGAGDAAWVPANTIANNINNYLSIIGVGNYTFLSTLFDVTVASMTVNPLKVQCQYSLMGNLAVACLTFQIQCVSPQYPNAGTLITQVFKITHPSVMYNSATGYVSHYTFMEGASHHEQTSGVTQVYTPGKFAVRNLTGVDTGTGFEVSYRFQAAASFSADIATFSTTIQYEVHT